MREYNCGALKRLPVPEERVRKALAVPDTVSAERSARGRSSAKAFRGLTWAASLALVILIGYTVYFLSRNMSGRLTTPPYAVDSTTAVDAEGVHDVTVPRTEATGETVGGTESVTADASVTVETLPDKTEASSVPTAEIIPTADSSQPTEETERSVTEPPAESAATEAPATEPDDDRDDDPPEPVEKSDDLASVGYMIPLSSYGGGDVYCRIYNSAGRLMGSDELYDDSHLVYYSDGSGYLFLSYLLKNVGEPLPPDNYTMVFYDMDGNDLCVCSAFLSHQ